MVTGSTGRMYLIRALCGLVFGLGSVFALACGLGKVKGNVSWLSFTHLAKSSHVGCAVKAGPVE